MFNKITVSIFLGMVFLDQVSKYLAVKFLSLAEGVVLIPNALVLQLIYNHGAAYGILQNQRFFLVGISLIVAIACLIFHQKITSTQLGRIGISFLVAGTLGNLMDRVLQGYVVDFIYIYVFPIFNVADVTIDIGIGLLILDSFLSPRATPKNQDTNLVNP